MWRTAKPACVATLVAAMQCGDAHADEGRHVSVPGEGVASSVTDLLSTSPTQLREFSEAIGSVFPMTPELVRQYRQIHEENERAIRETPFPEPLVDAILLTLEPGEHPAELRVAPGIASVIGFFDASGRPWPIRQFVIGNGDEFNVIQMGEKSGALAVSPLERVGWTNLVVALQGEPVPVVLRIVIDHDQAHFRRSVRILKHGPLSDGIAKVTHPELPRAGDRDLLAALSGVDLPAGAVAVPVSGVNARAWLAGEDLYLRSAHALLSPAWTSSLAGPGGLRAYRVDPVSSLLFSVDGRIVRADLALP